MSDDAQGFRAAFKNLGIPWSSDDAHVKRHLYFEKGLGAKKIKNRAKWTACHHGDKQSLLGFLVGAMASMDNEYQQGLLGDQILRDLRSEGENDYADLAQPYLEKGGERNHYSVFNANGHISTTQELERGFRNCNLNKKSQTSDVLNYILGECNVCSQKQKTWRLGGSGVSISTALGVIPSEVFYYAYRIVGENEFIKLGDDKYLMKGRSHIGSRSITPDMAAKYEETRTGKPPTFGDMSAIKLFRYEK